MITNATLTKIEKAGGARTSGDPFWAGAITLSARCVLMPQIAQAYAAQASELAATAMLTVLDSAMPGSVRVNDGDRLTLLLDRSGTSQRYVVRKANAVAKDHLSHVMAFLKAA